MISEAQPCCWPVYTQSPLQRTNEKKKDDQYMLQINCLHYTDKPPLFSPFL